jgi:hypothetical protein
LEASLFAGNATFSVLAHAEFGDSESGTELKIVYISECLAVNSHSAAIISSFVP